MPQYHVVTLITVKNLNNEDLDGYYGSVQVGYSWSQLVTEGHRWSQVVTLVTVKVKDISNDDLDGYFAS